MCGNSQDGELFQIRLKNGLAHPQEQFVDMNIQEGDLIRWLTQSNQTVVFHHH